jgi:AraC-like DNA-binding protein
MNTDIYKQPTVSASAILDLYDVLRKRSIVSSDINSVLGFNRNELMNIQMRVPATLQKRLWDLARIHGKFPNIGLIVGTQINENTVGMLSQLLIHSSSIREALSLFAKNISLMNECENVSIINKSWGCRIVYESNYAGYFGISEVERSLSSAVTWSRYLAGKKIYPLRVGVPHSEVDYSIEYMSIFGSDVRFNQKHAFIDIDNYNLNLSINTGNEYIKNALLNYVNNFIEDSTLVESTSTKVKSIIESQLDGGIFTSDDIAKKLNMSRQTLHRKLKKENINFSYLLKEVRKRKATEYLFSDTHQLEDVSFMLGFKEPSAFYRAFKSWFNMTPKTYRKISTNLI